MRHCSDAQLIDLLTGDDGAEAEQADGRRHLRACAACRDRYRAFASVWEPLGKWDVRPQGRDLVDAVQARAAARGRHARAPRRPWGLLRVAAALALSAGTGHLAARLIWREPEARVPVAVVARQQVIQRLMMDVVHAPSPLGLAAAVLQPRRDPAGDEP